VAETEVIQLLRLVLERRVPQIRAVVLEEAVGATALLLVMKARQVVRA
jgi:hypothetical protein